MFRGMKGEQNGERKKGRERKENTGRRRGKELGRN